jgi:hypothetical protein
MRRDQEHAVCFGNKCGYTNPRGDLCFAGN